MTMNSPSDTKQEHGGQQGSVHGHASDHGHTGEGSASVLEYLILQEQKHPRQPSDPDDAPAGSVHP